VKDYKDTVRNELVRLQANPPDIYSPTGMATALGSLILQICNGKRYTVDDAIAKHRGKSGSRGAFAGEPVVSVKQVISRPPPCRWMISGLALDWPPTSSLGSVDYFGLCWGWALSQSRQSKR
jgi:hypothetical protein